MSFRCRSLGRWPNTTVHPERGVLVESGFPQRRTHAILGPAANAEGDGAVRPLRSRRRRHQGLKQRPTANGQTTVYLISTFRSSATFAPCFNIIFHFELLTMFPSNKVLRTQHKSAARCDTWSYTGSRMFRVITFLPSAANSCPCRVTNECPYHGNRVTRSAAQSSSASLRSIRCHQRFWHTFPAAFPDAQSLNSRYSRPLVHNRARSLMPGAVSLPQNHFRFVASRRRSGVSPPVTNTGSPHHHLISGIPIAYP